MRAFTLQDYCGRLDALQRRLYLKDNGANTEDILFLLRLLENTRQRMLHAQSRRESLDIYTDFRAAYRCYPLFLKYGLEEI